MGLAGASSEANPNNFDMKWNFVGLKQMPRE